jgi:zinc protease
MKRSSRLSHFLVSAVSGGLLVALLAGPCIDLAGGQESGSSSLGKIERLNRAPVNKEILRVELPHPTVVKLQNGLRVVLIEDHKLPTVDFMLWVGPGQLGDPSDLPGLASFTADMLREGTERRTSAQIVQEVDSLGATLNTDSAFGSSYTAVGAVGLINDTERLLDLMSDIVLHPAFPASELMQYKRREEAALDQRFANPAFLAQQTLRRVLYGEAPLSVASPTRESIEKVTPEDLRKFHDQHYRPGNAILGVTGDFQTEGMRILIARFFAPWMGSAEPPVAVPTVSSSQPSKITLVDRPGSVQTLIVAVDKGIKRTDPDYYALQVMNQILGGGPQSRLFLDLREEHSYTYGAYSRFGAEIYPGDWNASAAVRTAVTDGSMERLVYEFKRINSELVPDNELDDARRSIVAGFALSLERPAELLSNVLLIQQFGLPDDYWNRYPDRISAVDAKAVQAAAKKYVDLEHMQWICVGDRTQIQAVLEKYGRVTLLNAEGKQQN